MYFKNFLEKYSETSIHFVSNAVNVYLHEATVQPPGSATPKHSGATCHGAASHFLNYSLRKQLSIRKTRTNRRQCPWHLRSLVTSLDKCFPGVISSLQQKQNRRTNEGARSHLPRGLQPRRSSSFSSSGGIQPLR